MKHRASSVVVALLLVGCAASSGNDPTADPPRDTDVAGATDPPVTDVGAPPTEPPATEPPTTEPPATEPPATEPPTPEPPATEPPANELPTTELPTTEPAAGVPPATEPPTTEPATTAPPAGSAVEVPRLGRVATAVPTQGSAVVHIGWALDRPWTPLAAWTGAGWMPADDARRSFPADTGAAVAVAGVEVGAPVTGLSYGAATAAICIDGREGPLLDAGGSTREFDGDGPYRAVGVAADWNVQPRGLRRSGLLSVDYQRIGESIVSAAGVDPAGGDVTDVVRADLDGNGVEEVFVTFEKITDGGGAPGDFVVIYVRFPTTGGNVVEQVLFEHYPQAWTSRPTVGRAGVLAVADLNGDGIMEVALWSKFWDSSLAELFVYDGATSLMSVGVSGCSL